MTREEAIKVLNMVEAHGLADEAKHIAIKALEQEPVLDKIISEIESCREGEEPHLCDYRHHRNEGLEIALDIIDKYKAENETWNGIHSQITAPKGTFERIYNDTESEEV